MFVNGSPLNAAYNDGKHHTLGRQSDILKVGKIPSIGSIILYNESVPQKDHRTTLPYRGCGIVSSQTDHLIIVEKAVKPGFFYKTTFRKCDFELGLMNFVQLKEIIYEEGMTYKDLDISKLPDTIKKLVI